MARSLGFERRFDGGRDAGGVRSGAAAAGADDVHGRVMRAVGVVLALIGGFGIVLTMGVFVLSSVCWEYCEDEPTVGHSLQIALPFGVAHARVPHRGRASVDAGAWLVAARARRGDRLGRARRAADVGGRRALGGDRGRPARGYRAPRAGGRVAVRDRVRGRGGCEFSVGACRSLAGGRVRGRLRTEGVAPAVLRRRLPHPVRPRDRVARRARGLGLPGRRRAMRSRWRCCWRRRSRRCCWARGCSATAARATGTY